MPSPGWAETRISPYSCGAVAAEASVVACRFLLRPAGPDRHRGPGELLVHASIGVARQHCGFALSPSAEDILQDADLAMYLAKSSGQNHFKSPTHTGWIKAVRQRAELATDIRRALESDELELHYQPVVLGCRWEPRGVEALLRWHHPVRGPRSHQADVSSPSGGRDRATSVPSGAWVTTHGGGPGRGSMAAHSWRGCEDLHLAVNLSAIQMQGDGLAEMVELHICTRPGSTPTCLTLEVTESMLLLDLDAARTAARRRCASWACVSPVDDFGTGYSSSFPTSRGFPPTS